MPSRICFNHAVEDEAHISERQQPFTGKIIYWANDAFSCTHDIIWHQPMSATIRLILCIIVLFIKLSYRSALGEMHHIWLLPNDARGRWPTDAPGIYISLHEASGCSAADFWYNAEPLLTGRGDASMRWQPTNASIKLHDLAT